MKNRFIILMIAFVGMFLVTSCDKWISPELGIDPNNPDDVPVELILPGVPVGLGYLMGGDAGRFTSLFTQHMAGTGRQHLVIDRYSFTESDVDNIWRFSLYGGTLSDLAILIEKANAEGSPHYAGVGKVYQALILGVSTDLWGDIPFSDAFQGLDELQPAYDSQESIYNLIFSLLDAAIVDMAAAESVKSPDGASDPLYGGDLALWTSAAYALKARYQNHLSQRDPSGSADAVIATLTAGGFTSNSEDLEYNFSSSVNGNNPWFQFQEQRGDILAGGFFVDLMNGLDDPRRTVFLNDTVTGGVYAGSPAGDPGPEASDMGAYYSSPNSPVPFMSYVEQLFIRAEAELREGSTAGEDNAATYHNMAVTESLAKFGVTDAAYLAANASETGNTITLEKIMDQKYIAMFTQCESWTDWRRTGLPVLTAAANNVTGDVIPTRWPYPQSERLFNGSNVPNGGLTTNVWWDQ